jgi:carbamoyl-phosphate synthase large subunit
MLLCQSLKETKLKNNILVLSAGRRVELVRIFQHELKKQYDEAIVVAADMNIARSAACQVADKSFSVPRATSDEYVSSLLEICKDNSIGMVIPTIDTELQVLSDNEALFMEIGVKLIVSKPHLIEKCRDKRKSAELFSSMNVRYPEIYDTSSIKYPCFCKPYDGSCSIGAKALMSSEDITEELLSDPKNMFMELIDSSYCEYTIDGYYDQNNTLKCLVPRKRLEVRGGEVSKGKTMKNFVFDFLQTKLKHLDGAIGCITFQFFVNETKEDIVGLEINPRFGGGYPLTYAAGGNFPKWLIWEYFGLELVHESQEWEPNLVMLRYDSQVLLSEDT